MASDSKEIVQVLNRELPYGEVFGAGKVRFIQGGLKFDFSGDLVEDGYELDRPLVSNSERRKAKADAKASEKAARREAFLKPVDIKAPVEEKPIVAEMDPDDDWAALPEKETEDLESLHWTKLRKRVEDAGGTYTGKDDAINWLQANE